jgi:sugar lactone lactonase YvrE
MKKIRFSPFVYIALCASLFLGSCKDEPEIITPEEPKPVQPRAYTTVSTFAGSTTAQSGNANGTGNDARFNSTKSAVQDSDGNLYVADGANHVIRKITPAGVVTTFAGTAGTFGGTNGTGTIATFNLPYGLAIDASNNIYVAEQNGYRIRKITPAGEVTTLAGSGVAGSADGTGTNAQFQFPRGLALDNAGNLFVTDNKIIRKIVIATGVVTTFAGGGTTFDGQGTSAKFYVPDQLCMDKQNNLYVADGRAVRKITPAGVVSTIAGNIGVGGFQNGQGSNAFFSQLTGIAIDAVGYLYATEYLHGAVRRIAQDGTVTDFAGVVGIAGQSSVAVQQGDTDGALTTARFRYPSYIHCGKDNILYVCEESGHRVRKIQ